MRFRRTVVVTIVSLTATVAAFAGERITPPISVPQANPSNFVQCAATNVHTNKVNVTMEILNRHGQTIVGPTTTLLQPLNSTTIFKFLPASAPFICRITFAGRSDLVTGTMEACSYTGVAGGLFDCSNTTAQERPSGLSQL